MTRAPSVSVVMQTFNRREGLRRVVEAVLADPAAEELVMVVNGCADGSGELLERLAREHDRLRLVHLQAAPRAKAREEGVRAATGDVVLMLDDDVLAEPGLVGGHAARHAGRDDLVVLGYMPVAEESLRAGGIPAQFYSADYEAQVPGWEAAPGRVLHGLWCGNVSLRREHALEVSPATPEFTARANQDREWGLRLRKAGLVGVFDRGLRAQHLYSRSVAAYVDYQAASGGGTWLVHALHSDVIGRLPQDHYFHHLPPSGQRCVRLARRPRSQRLVRLAALAARASERGPRWIHRGATRIALTMAQQRAALEASRRARIPT